VTAVGAADSRIKIGGAPTTCHSAAPESALAVLRQATANIHESLHRNPSFKRLMSGDLELTEYTALLGCLYGFYFPLENMLRVDAPPILSVDFKTREKAHLLRADLVSLGMSTAAISALPMCSSFPPIRSQENVVGCLYVIEGAGRGGTVMARKLDYLFGSESSAGRSFFFGRTDPDPLPWGFFCELLETCAKRGSLDDIVEGASRTFSAFSHWLNTGCRHV
jgi:heme oxygenase